MVGNCGELSKIIFKLFKIKTKNKPAKIITPAKPIARSEHGDAASSVPNGTILIKAKKGSEERNNAGQTSREP